MKLKSLWFSFVLMLAPVIAFADEYELTDDLEGRWRVFLDWSMMALYYGLKIWQ